MKEMHSNLIETNPSWIKPFNFKKVPKFFWRAPYAALVIFGMVASMPVAWNRASAATCYDRVKCDYWGCTNLYECKSYSSDNFTFGDVDPSKDIQTASSDPCGYQWGPLFGLCGLSPTSYPCGGWLPLGNSPNCPDNTPPAE